MKIKLNDKFQVVGIPMNFVLEEKKINLKTGEEYWQTAGYYPTLEILLHGLFRRGLQESETEGVQNIIQELIFGVQAIMIKIELLQEDSKAEVESED